MHRTFRKALDTATGEQRSIIAVIVDIRDFSPFSLKQDSFDIAMFLKRAYINVIDSYFGFASFYKSTGDGLLLTVPFSANNLKEVVKKTIESCIACHREFGNICVGDPMITFPVPDKVGIGVARGSACCLVAGSKGRKIIDYSGRLLNLTSRLTALARPSGIVVDQSLGIDLLDKDMRGTFVAKEVYLDGIAEVTPITVYFTKEFTKIPQHNIRPIAETVWKHVYLSLPFKEIVDSMPWYQLALESEPTGGEDMEVTVRHQKVTRRKTDKKSDLIYRFREFEYSPVAGKPIVKLHFKKLSQALKKSNVKRNTIVRIDVAYAEK